MTYCCVIFWLSCGMVCFTVLAVLLYASFMVDGFVGYEFVPEVVLG